MFSPLGLSRRAHTVLSTTIGELFDKTNEVAFVDELKHLSKMHADLPFPEDRNHAAEVLEAMRRAKPDLPL